MEHTTDSISEWLGRLKAGEADAAQKLWERYSGELLRHAKQRLKKVPNGIADEEDVALSVFGSMCRGATEGRLDQITTRDELWWLLLSISQQKVVNHIRRETAEKRYYRQGAPGLKCGAVALATGPFSLGDLVGSTPTPDFLVALEEQYKLLLGMLRNDKLRQIAILRIEGYTEAELAQKMSLGLRAIERKLQLIRNKWKRLLINPDLGQ
jgi:DNA-directed RNA polymerase specialized sigma24 family protein